MSELEEAALNNNDRPALKEICDNSCLQSSTTAASSNKSVVKKGNNNSLPVTTTTITTVNNNLKETLITAATASPIVPESLQKTEEIFKRNESSTDGKVINEKGPKEKENCFNETLNINQDNNEDNINSKNNVLPDIVNVQILPVKESEKQNPSDESLISLLANNLNGLALNSSNDVNHLNIPTISNCDGGISSDDEFYAECQTFSETTEQNFDNITTTITSTTFTGTPTGSIENIQNATVNVNRDNFVPSIASPTTTTSFANGNDKINLQSCSFGNGHDHDFSTTIQTENEFVSASNLTMNTTAAGSVIVDALATTTTATAGECTPVKDSSLNKSSETDNGKDETKSNFEKSFEILNGSKNGTNDQSHDDSIDGLDIYIPQVLLRQTGEKYSPKEPLSTTTTTDSEINKEQKLTNGFNSTGNSDMSSLNNSNITSSISNANASENDNKEAIIQDDVPLSLKLSTDSLEEDANVNSNLVSQNEQFEFKAMNIASTPLPSQFSPFIIDRTLNISNLNPSVQPADEKRMSKSIVDNASKILNCSFDNAAMNSEEIPPVIPSSSSSVANITFAASSEAINSTIVAPIQSNFSFENSFKDDHIGTSFNHNETVPVGEVNRESPPLEMNHSPPRNNDFITTKTKEMEMENSNRSSFSSLSSPSLAVPAITISNSSKESLNSSVEPMDIDMSPEKQPLSSSPATNQSPEILEQKDVETERKLQFEEQNKEFGISVNDFEIPASSLEINENFSSEKIDFEFKAPINPVPPFTAAVATTSNKNLKRNSQGFCTMTDDDFKGQPGLILSPNDFDFLLSKGSDNISINRDSLLLRFDPLLGHPIPVNQQHQQNSIESTSALTAATSSRKINCLSSTAEEKEEEDTQSSTSSSSSSLPNIQKIDEFNDDTDNHHLNRSIPISSNCSDKINYKKLNNSSIDLATAATKIISSEGKYTSSLIRPTSDKVSLNLSQEDNKGNVKMSVDVIHQDIEIQNNDINKSIDNNLSTQSEEKQDYKMEDLEKKLKNEVLKTEDIEKKLKDAEQREEALLKRITEKDKTIAKMSGVIEAYEKAVAELIAEKEQIKQDYERQITELKSDRDSNYQHLISLETTFSDLHVKYERSKQNAEKLRKSEEDLLAEKRQTAENLRLQEQRYEKMKNHALQQLEIANNKLELLSKNHAAEVTKLKALLKKEEISRLSIAEQLQQKARENEELMKICDELINGQGS